MVSVDVKHHVYLLTYSSIPLSPGCVFAVASCVHVFISGESLHCFLVGVIKSYVIATSDS